MIFDTFQKEYRAIEKSGGVKIYHEKSSFFVDHAINFDVENERFASIDLFVTGVVSDIILTMRNVAKKRNILIQDMEAKVRVTIHNPMATLFVVGYDEISFIEQIVLDLYYFTFLEKEEREVFLREVLHRSLIYQTIKEKVRVQFKEVL